MARIERLEKLPIMCMSYYQDLDIWKKSLDTITEIYKLTQSFPQAEQYSLVDQMKRAAVSVASNIAEWSGRGSIADNLRFLTIARGSLVELEAQVHISIRLWFIERVDSENLLSSLLSLQKMLSSFMSAKKKYAQSS
jgi:four helix bundle protein